MLFLVAYDIPNDGTRTQVADELETVGTGSRFCFGWDLDQVRCVVMVDQLRKLICAKDSIRIHRICQTCESTLLGRGRPGYLRFVISRG